MSLQRKLWFENINGVKVDKQLDESKLLLESEKGDPAYWEEALEGMVPDEYLEALAWILSQMFVGNGMDHLELERIKEMLEGLDLDGLKGDVEDIMRRLLDGETITPTHVPPVVPPIVEPPTPITPTYQPPYPTNKPRPQH
jgi:hypothetical protein